ncbi:MAG: DMT family transporter [Ktedonobacteraceae bacterium]
MSRKADLHHVPSNPSPSSSVQQTDRRSVSALTKGVPPQLFALLAIISVQLGSAVSKSLFQSIGPLGTTFLRLIFAAVLLLLIWRPRLHGYTRRHLLLIALFGITIAAMNTVFYAAIARIPLGIAVSLEFVGPLGVALIQSRHLKDLVWAALAAGGILLLAPIGPTHLDPLGVGLALLAGCFWGTYILLNVQMGRASTGGGGLALSMAVAACVIAPWGSINGGMRLLDPQVLLIGFAVAVLSTVIPFSLELEALRRLPSRVFGILMSIEPAIGALMGFLVLGEVIGPREMIAFALVIAASVGVSLEGNAHK